MVVALVIVVASASVAVAALVVDSEPVHGRWTSDVAGNGIQEHHQGSPPRVGLAPILAGCTVAAFLLANNDSEDGVDMLFVQLLLCGLPAGLMGLLEELTKSERARWRIVAPTALL